MIYLLMISYTICGALGALFLKLSTHKKNNLLEILILNRYIYIGIFFYILGILGNIVVLKYLPYGIVYSMSGLTYLWTFILGVTYLNERIGLRKIYSGSCILLGIVLISFGI